MPFTLLFCLVSVWTREWGASSGRSIKGHTSSLISVNGEQRTQPALVHCRDTITVRTAQLTKTKWRMEMMTGKSFRNAAEGGVRVDSGEEGGTERIKGSSTQWRGGGGWGVFSGDRQSKIVLSWDQRGGSVCVFAMCWVSCFFLWNSKKSINSHSPLLLVSV